ncbi:hypothetical protein [Leptospira stimsonii]|uniref:Lipoprotein n=1 Tax=Leptospira stimsonii TaxID=2202203 RepID=A0A396YUF9_9LEPT|nr:hypothetical protein [Leptospira stimsonii]RHX85553.1 hypothetical protein DLM75_20365 [Leptospira stimsonii]
MKRVKIKSLIYLIVTIAILNCNHSHTENEDDYRHRLKMVEASILNFCGFPTPIGFATPNPFGFLGPLFPTDIKFYRAKDVNYCIGQVLLNTKCGDSYGSTILNIRLVESAFCNPPKKCAISDVDFGRGGLCFD